MLRARNISRSYGDLMAIKDISLEVSPNEIVGLVGPSGCGKTTALNIFSGHDNDFSGSLENSFDKLSYVFQEDRLLPWCNVWDNIRIVNDDIENSELEHLLNIMELGDFKKSFPAELSGGMRQRVSIARAFAYKGDLLLMDEPFKSLDQKLKESLLRSLIKLFMETDLAILIVTHDQIEAKILCDRIIMLTSRPSEVQDVILNPGNKLDRLDEVVSRAKEWRNA